jgi:hypothetical protein
MQDNDLEIRVRRLEQLHIWGASILALGLIVVLYKQYSKK